MRVPKGLEHVREYATVKCMTTRPNTMRIAYSTPLPTPESVVALVAKMYRLLGYPKPIPKVQMGRKSWAKVNSNVLNIRSENTEVHVVLHEIAHLLAPRERRGNRRICHGEQFTKTLDHLLEIWYVNSLKQ